MKLNLARRIILIFYAIGFVFATFFAIPKVNPYSYVTDTTAYIGRLAAWTVVCGVAFLVAAPYKKKQD